MSASHRDVAERAHLLGLTPEELASYLGGRGVRASVAEARRYVAHVVARGERGVPRRPPSRRFLDGVAEHVDRSRLEVVERVTDEADGFVKYLLR